MRIYANAKNIEEYDNEGNLQQQNKDKEILFESSNDEIIQHKSI